MQTQLFLGNTDIHFFSFRLRFNFKQKLTRVLLLLGMLIGFNLCANAQTSSAAAIAWADSVLDKKLNFSWANPSNASHIIVSGPGMGLLQTNNKGKGWYDITAGSTLYHSALVYSSNKVICFQLAPSDANICYNLLQSREEPAMNTWRLAFGSRMASNSWTWKERTEPLVSAVGSRFGYSSLCIDPKNADRLFTTFGNTNWGKPGKDRVHVSSNNGITYSDMSTGLSELPINVIVYQNGSDDVLYVGCDDGVYYYHKPTLCWIKMAGNFPSCSITDLRIDYNNAKLIVGTKDGGVSEFDLIQIANQAANSLYTIITNKKKYSNKVVIKK